MNILIMWFPQFNEELKHIRGVFEQYGEFKQGCFSVPWDAMVDYFCILTLYILLIDEDTNGSIDLEELKKCLQKLTLTLKEEEVEDLFHSCDIDNSMSSMFLEVIYLLVEHSSSPPKSIHLKLHFIFIHMFDVKTSTYCDHPYMMAWGFCFRHWRWVHQSFRPLLIQL